MSSSDGGDRWDDEVGHHVRQFLVGDGWARVAPADVQVGDLIIDTYEMTWRVVDAPRDIPEWVNDNIWCVVSNSTFGLQEFGYEIVMFGDDQIYRWPNYYKGLWRKERSHDDGSG